MAAGTAGRSPGVVWKRLRRELGHLKDPKYLKWRWNLRVVKPRYGLETIRDFVIDERYGGRCGGTYSSQWNHKGYRGTSSAHYYYLANIFNGSDVRIEPSDVLVDVGCGKGRVLNFWLHSGARNRMVGIEIDERWASFASARLARYENVTVLCGDAFELLPPDGTIFFIFNPFKREACQTFKERLENLRDVGPPITLVYYMCDSGDLFWDDPAWEVSRVEGRTFHPTIVARYHQPAS